MGTPNRAEYELLDIGAKRCFGKEKSQQVMMGMGNTKNTSNHSKYDDQIQIW